MTEYRIPSWRLSHFLSIVEKLNRRAVKLSCAPIVVNVLREEQTTIGVNKRIIKLSVITVEGAAPKMGGWRFISKLEHDEAIGTIVRTAPGEITPPAFFNGKSTNCDHCHKALYRKDTFVVAHEDGRFAQVGRRCLRDFLGHIDPERLAGWFAVLLDVADLAERESDPSGWGEGGSNQDYYWDIKDFLSLTSAIITKHGWVSSKEAQTSSKCPTSGRVIQYLMPAKNERREALEITEGGGTGRLRE